MNIKVNQKTVVDILTQSATGKDAYIAPHIRVYEMEHEGHLLVPSNIKPTPGGGGPEVEDPDEDNEELEFE
jgi:hypothetical protein